MRRARCIVLVSAIPDTVTLPADAQLPEARRKLLEETREPKLYAARVTDWQVLEKAVRLHSGLDLNTLSPRMEANGRWVADGIRFSLTHTSGYCAAAVCDRAVGVDMERSDRFPEQSELGRLAARIGSADTPDAVLHAWTAKEALYKRSGLSVFIPRDHDPRNAYTHRLDSIGCVLSVTERDTEILDADTLRPIK